MFFIVQLTEHIRNKHKTDYAVMKCYLTPQCRFASKTVLLYRFAPAMLLELRDGKGQMLMLVVVAAAALQEAPKARW